MCVGRAGQGEDGGAAGTVGGEREVLHVPFVGERGRAGDYMQSAEGCGHAHATTSVDKLETDVCRCCHSERTRVQP